MQPGIVAAAEEGAEEVVRWDVVVAGAARDLAVEVRLVVRGCVRVGKRRYFRKMLAETMVLAVRVL
jgi:hypothetical protein